MFLQTGFEVWEMLCSPCPSILSCVLMVDPEDELKNITNRGYSGCSCDWRKKFPRRTICRCQARSLLSPCAVLRVLLPCTLLSPKSVSS